jgi:hypothetical protein
MIQVLDGRGGPVHENKEMLKIAVDYYKDLFCLEPRPEIRLKPDLFGTSVNLEFSTISTHLVLYCFIRLRMRLDFGCLRGQNAWANYYGESKLL